MMVVVAVMIVVATVTVATVAVLVVVHEDAGSVPAVRVRVPSIGARAVRSGRLRRRAQQEEGSGTNREEDGDRPT